MKYCQRPTIHPEIGHILNGIHPRVDNVVLDRDYSNPIRADNQSTQLLKAKLSGKLSSELGLSNLMVWMGTGQGDRTRHFIEQGDMFFDNLDDCVTRFQVANDSNFDLSSNVSGRNHDHETSFHSIKKHPSYLHFDNQIFYGTANPHLSVMLTTKRMLMSSESETGCAFIRDKFAPYFCEKIRSEWCGFLGKLLNWDLADRPLEDDLHSWTETLDFIHGLKVVGFQSGLTPFQTTNMIALCGLCKLPTEIEMARWVAGHANKGAVAGLSQLKFQADSYSRTQAAFLAFHSFLNINLTSDDKAILRFSPIFTEHLLCKTNRWDRLLEAYAELSLAKLGAKAQEEKWLPGRNLNDSNAFPFPCIFKRNELDAFLKSLTCVEDPSKLDHLR